MKKMIWVVAATWLGLSWVSSASATLVYQYTFDQANYTLLPSDTVAVPVYLTETVTGGSTSVFATDGLLTAGVRLSFLPSIPGTPSTVTSLSSIVANPAFDGANSRYLANDSDPNPGHGVNFVDPSATNVVAGLGAAVDFLSPAVTASGGGPTYRILIGTFTFQAGAPYSVTKIGASDLFTNQDDTTTGTGFVLDPFLQSNSFTITVVPEPASWALAMMGLVVGGVVMLRRSSAHVNARD